MKTKRELVTAMLRRARIVGGLTTPSSEDFDRVGSVYDTRLEEWRDRNLVYWENTDSDTEEIPTACFEVLVDLLINAAESQFGKNSHISPLERRAIEDRLLSSLRRHTRMRSAGLPNQVDYF